MQVDLPRRPAAVVLAERQAERAGVAPDAGLAQRVADGHLVVRTVIDHQHGVVDVRVVAHGRVRRAVGLFVGVVRVLEALELETACRVAVGFPGDGVVHPALEVVQTGRVGVAARPERFTAHAPGVRRELAAGVALLGGNAEQLVSRPRVGAVVRRRTRCRLGLGGAVPARRAEERHRQAGCLVAGRRVRGEAQHLLLVGPSLRVREVVRVLAERCAARRVAGVDRVVQPAQAVRAVRTVLALLVVSRVVRPHRVEPVLQALRVVVVQRHALGLHLVPLADQQLKSRGDVRRVVRGDRDLLVVRLRVVGGVRLGMTGKSHAVGHLRDAVAAVGLVPVDVPVRRVGDVEAVVVADQRVAVLTGQGVAVGLPQVRLLTEDAEQDLHRHVCVRRTGQLRQLEHALRRVRADAVPVPVRGPGVVQVVLDRHVRRPLHLTRLGLHHLDLEVVARHRAHAVRVGRVLRRDGTRGRGLRD